MDKTSKRTLNTAVIVFVFMVLAALFSYLFRMLLARKLTLVEFGLFFSMVAFFNVLIIFRDIGLSQVLVVYVPKLHSLGKIGELKQLLKRVLQVEIVNSIIIFLIVAAISGLLAERYFHFDQPMLILLFGFVFILSSIELNIHILFQSFQLYFIYSLHNLLRAVLSFGLCWMFFRFDSGIRVPILTYGVVYLLLLVGFGAVLWRKLSLLRIKRRAANAEKSYPMKGAIVFGLLGALSTLGYVLMTSLDTLLLTYFRTLEEVGLYNTAVPIITLLLYFSTALVTVMIPLTSQLHAKNQLKTLRILIETITKYIFVIFVFVAGVLVLFAEPLLIVLFGDGFAAAALPLRILAVGSIFFGVAAIYLNTLLSIDGPRKSIRAYVAGVLLMFAAGLFSIPAYGIVGAAFATVIGYMVAFMVSYYEVHALLNARLAPMLLLKLFGAAFITFGLINYIKNAPGLPPIYNAMVMTLVAAIVYFGLLLLLRAMSFKELALLLKQTRKKPAVKTKRE